MKKVFGILMYIYVNIYFYCLLITDEFDFNCYYVDKLVPPVTPCRFIRGSNLSLSQIPGRTSICLDYKSRENVTNKITFSNMIETKQNLEVEVYYVLILLKK